MKLPPNFDAIYARWHESCDYSPTLQGELLGCALALGNEAERNGTGNWEMGCRSEDAEFLGDHLPDAAVFDATQRMQIKADIRRILRHSPSGRGSNYLLRLDPYSRLLSATVAFCEARMEPLPNRRWVEPVVYTPVVKAPPKTRRKSSWNWLKIHPEDPLETLIIEDSGVLEPRPDLRLGEATRLTFVRVVGYRSLAGLVLPDTVHTLQVRCEEWSDGNQLVHLRAVERLDLWGCYGLSDFEFLRRMPSLRCLDLRECLSLEDVGPLSALSRLDALSLRFCDRVSDVSELTALPRLRILDLRGTGVRTLAPLRAHPTLETVYVDKKVRIPKALRDKVVRGEQASVAVVAFPSD